MRHLPLLTALVFLLGCQPGIDVARNRAATIQLERTELALGSINGDPGQAERIFLLLRSEAAQRGWDIHDGREEERPGTATLHLTVIKWPNATVVADLEREHWSRGAGPATREHVPVAAYRAEAVLRSELIDEHGRARLSAVDYHGVGVAVPDGDRSGIYHYRGDATPVAIEPGELSTAVTAALRHALAGLLDDLQPSIHTEHITVSDHDPQQEPILELARQGDFLSAHERLQSLVAREPDNPHAHFNLGAMCEALEHYDEALEHYARALALRPHDEWERVEQRCRIRRAAHLH